MEKLSINNELSIVAIPNLVLFPGGDIKVQLAMDISKNLYEKIEDENNYAIGLTVKNHKDDGLYEEEDFYRIGSLIKVKDRKRVIEGYEYNIEIVERIKVKQLILIDNNLRAKYESIPDIIDLNDNEQEQILDIIKNSSIEIAQNFRGAEAYAEHIKTIDNIEGLIAYLIPYINLPLKEKQEFLEITSLRERSLKMLDILIEYKTSIQFQMEIASKVNEEMNDTYKENMLRKQLEVIQDELGDKDGKKEKKKNYEELIKTSGMPDDVREVALRELDKFNRQNPNSPEINVIQNYLDLLTSLPWGQSEIRDIDIKEARNILDKDHYGLDKVKDRIIQHLTVMKLKENKQGSILLLVGPPGTGKTSLGKSIAEALNRKYVRISLGGVRDEAEIRGHRRTYVGALPGRIIQGMRKAGEKNPVFILDEVDKLVKAGNGDPSSALLEVLDPEQNNSFADHYLEVPYDLSDVFFVATANSLKDIPGPLRDRMEIINISSYTSYEKFHIGRNHLVDQALEDNGLNEEQLQIEDETIKLIIEKYTREAGVRELKRQLSKVARVITEKVVEGKTPLPYVVKPDMIFDILGHEVANYDRVNKINPPGVATGLAWTPVGGDILFIEGVMMPGKGHLILTGKLGDVMKESARISQSLIRSRLAFNLKGLEFDKYDLHIHVPAGAIPKDGPSAGVALFTAIASLVTGHPIDPKLAMTGEISLRGAVLQVGGIKEKVLAAHRSGIERIILPKDNEKDLRDIPKEVKDELEFILVETIEELIKETLDIELPKVEITSFMSTDMKELNM